MAHSIPGRRREHQLRVPAVRWLAHPGVGADADALPSRPAVRPFSEGHPQAAPVEFGAWPQIVPVSSSNGVRVTIDEP